MSAGPDNGSVTPAVPSASFFVVSGTLPLHSHSYVPRQADKDLLSALLAGEYCFVLNSRQMGKSSLSVRTMAKLQEAGVKTVFIDLTKLGGSNVTPEQWYIGLLSETGRALGLRKEMLAYWKENQEYSLVQRYFGALHDVALANTASRLMLFIDEIDAVKSLSFSTDEFFAAIRECYNRRVQEAEYSRLTFVLVGSATASDLIQDTRTSPFNIGKRIELKDFTEAETLALAEGIAGPNAQALVQRAFYWTNGHPFLTQALCAEIAVDARVQKPANVDRLMEGLFFEAKARERNVNLSDVSNRILSSYLDAEHKEEHRAAILDLYRQVGNRRMRVVEDETNRLVAVLKLSGITRSVDGELQVRNRIYEGVFDRTWIEQSMPDAELRRQRQAYRAGMLRTGMVATAVVLMMAILAGWALANAKEAREARNQARGDAKRAKAAEAAAKILQSQASADAQRAKLAEADAKRKASLLEASVRKEKAAREDAHKKATEAAVSAQQAQNQAYKANQNQRAAETAQRGSAAQTLRVQRAEKQTHRLLYLADMNVAHQAYNDSNFARGIDLLYRHHNDPERGFEWDYLYHLTHQELFTLRGHTQPITASALSPDGKRFVTGSQDGTLKVWNTETGKDLLTLQGHVGTVSNVAISPDGKQIASKGLDKNVHLWDAQTGKRLFSVVVQLYSPVPPAFSPDSRCIAIGMGDNSVKICDAHTDKELLLLKDDAARCTVFAAFAPDGKRIVTSGEGASAKVWDAQTGAALLTLTPTSHTPLQREGQAISQICLNLVFSPDGKRLATESTDGSTRIWDAETGKELHTLATRITGNVMFAFSPDGKRLLTSDNGTTLWNAETGAALFTLKGITGHINMIAFSPDSQRILTAGADGCARIWDAHVGNELFAFKGHNGPVVYAAFSADGKRIVTSSGDATAKIWNPTGDTGMRVLANNPRGISTAAISPDGTRIVSAGNDKIAHLWDSRTGKELFPLDGQPVGVGAAAFSPDGRRVALGGQDGITRIWDALSGEKLREFPKQPASIYAIAFSPDGRRVVTCNGTPERRVGSADPVGIASTARVWEAETGKELVTLQNRLAETYAVFFSPDGKRIFTGDKDGIPCIWDSMSGKKLKEFPKQAGAIYAIAQSPDGARLATAGAEGVTKIWSAVTGEEIIKLSRSTGAINSVAFSPDGKRLVTGGSDQAVHTWDVQNGTELLTLKGASSEIFSTAFAPDGKRIVVGSGDGAIRIWEGSPRSRASEAWIDERARDLGEYEIAGQWDKAIGILSTMLQDNPNRLDLRFRRATAYAKRKQWSLALTDMKPCAVDWHTPDQWAPLALLALAAGHQADYRGICEMLLKNYGSDPKTMEGVARVCTMAPSALRDYSSLRTLLLQQRQAQPMNTYLALEQGLVEFRAGDYRDASRTLNRLASIVGYRPDGWLCLAMAQFRLHNEARARLVQSHGAAEIASEPPPIPDDWVWKLRFQLMLRESQRMLGAGDPHREESLRLQAQQQRAWSVEASRHEEGRRWEQALPLLTRLLQADPQNEDWRSRRGNAYANLREWTQALADYNRCDTDARQPADWNRLALLYLAAGDQAGYQATCQAMVARLGETSAGWACGFAPHALTEYGRLLAHSAVAIKAQPDVYTNIQYGGLLYRAGQWTEAIRTLEELEKKASFFSGNDAHYHANTWLYLTMAYGRSGQVQAARQALNHALESFDAQGAWEDQLLGQLQLREAQTVLGMDEGAVALMDRTLRVTGQMRQAARTRQWAQAVAAATELLGIEPHEMGTYGARASYYRQLNRQPEAEADYKQAIDIATERIRMDPDKTETFVSRAGYYLQLNRRDEAEADYKAASIPSMPLNSDLRSGDSTERVALMFYNNTGCTLRLYSIDKEGKRRSLYAIRTMPDVQGVFAYVSQVLLVTNSEEKPVGLYLVPPGTHVVYIVPTVDTPAWYSRLGKAHAEAGRWQEARNAFNDAVQRESDDWNDYHRLAVTQLALGDRAGYQHTCEQAFRRWGVEAPDWTCHIGPNALSDYTAILAAEQEHLQRSPDDIGRKITMGALTYRAGKYKEAVAILTPLLTPDSGYADNWLYLAMAHWHLGNKTEARRCLKLGENGIANRNTPEWYLREQFVLQLQEAHALITPE